MVELINMKIISFPIRHAHRAKAWPQPVWNQGLINEKLAEIEEKYDLNSAVMPDGFVKRVIGCAKRSRNG